MVIKLNLAHSGAKAVVSQDVNRKICYIFCFVSAIFLFTSAAVFVTASMRISALSEEKANYITEKAKLSQTITLLDEEFKRVSNKAAVIDKRLSYVLSEIPSLEIISDLNNFLPDGLFIKSIKVSVDKAVFTGLAMKENLIMELSDKLLERSFVSAVEVPDIAFVKINENSLYSFSVTCKLHSISEISTTKPFVKRRNKDALAQEYYD